MAKAMAKAKANKAASKTPVFKKRSASSSNAPPPKRRSYNQQQDKAIVCFTCQQPGHISPRCPNRQVASTPTNKIPAKK